MVKGEFFRDARLTSQAGRRSSDARGECAVAVVPEWQRLASGMKD
jgi:hypothetical protein